jgi:hypothetical protein
MQGTTPNKYGLHTRIDAPMDDVNIFQLESEYGPVTDKRLVTKYDFRPRILQHFIAYCMQKKEENRVFELPFEATWERTFYDGHFAGKPEERMSDLRKGDVHWRVRIPQEDESKTLAELLAEVKSTTGHTLWAIPQSFDSQRKVYPLISEGDLTYVETSDEGQSYKRILSFDKGDLPFMIRNLGLNCKRRGHGNIPGWLYLEAMNARS